MMRIAEIIAERSIEIERVSAPLSTAVITFGKPAPDPRPGGDWECGYVVKGGGLSIEGFAYGVDPLQALLHAIQKVSAELDHYRRASGVRITWLGSDELGLA